MLRRPLLLCSAWIGQARGSAFLKSYKPDSAPGALVVGMSTFDVFIRCTRLPSRGEQITLDEYLASPGGAGVNISIALSFLKVPVALSTRVGADSGGRLVRELLEARQIQSGHVAEDPVAPTSFSLVNVAADGEIGLLHHEGANANLGLEDISADALANCEAVHLAGAMSLPKLDGGPAAQLMREAKALGKQTSLNTSRFTSRSSTLHSIFPHLDLIFANLQEALVASGCEDYESAAAWFRKKGVRQAVVTLGRSGTYVANADFSGMVQAIPVHATDTTGCGDAFVAAFLYAARAGFSTATCVAWGNALGAHCARTRGALVTPFEAREINALCETNNLYGGLCAFVLGGGASRRMEGAEQKLILPVCGKPMITWVIETLRAAGIHRIVVLTGHQAAAIERTLRGQPIEFFKASDFPLGTGGSVRAAMMELGNLPETILVVNGDTPLVRVETISSLLERHFRSQAKATVVTATSPDVLRYTHGGIIRDSSGGFSKVSHFLVTGERTPSHEVNTGTYCFTRDPLHSACEKLGTALDGKQHLSDVLAVLSANGGFVRLEHSADFSEFISANTRGNLSEIEGLLRERQRSEARTQ